MGDKGNGREMMTRGSGDDEVGDDDMREERQGG